MINITQRIGMITIMFLTLTVIISASVYAADNGYVVIDPDKFSDWEVVGPNGGDVRVVAVDPHDKDRLYISTLDGQIHASSDAGRTWKLLVNFNEPQLVLDQLMVDLRDSNRIYSSGHRHKLPGGFFFSADRGQTWRKSKALANESIHSMTQSSFDPDLLTVGTLKGVWVSKNSGDDWEKIESATMPQNINSMAVDPRNTSTIYAGTWWRPYKSTDSGKSWSLIKNGMIDDSDVFAISIDPRNPNHVIASACSGIYESRNAGGRWSKIQGIPAQSRRTRDILQHPSVPGTVYAATTEGFWMSTNGGKSWMLTTNRDLEINSVTVHPDAPSRVYIGTNNYGVMVSDDGGKNWAETNQNFSSRFTYSISPDIEQPDRLYATTHNTSTSGGFFFISADGGKSWQAASGLDVNRVSAFALLQDRIDTNRLFLGTNLGIFQSVDRGASWTFIAPPKPAKKKAVGKKKGIIAKPEKPMDPVGPKLIPAFTAKVKALTFSEDGKNTIFAGTDTGLYKAVDISKGWEKVPLGDGVNENIFVVTTSLKRPDTIWVGTATSGVMISRDGGMTWSAIKGTPEGVPVSAIVVDPKRPDHVYVGTIQGLYMTRDGGKNWTFGRGLPLGNYAGILINPEYTNEVYISSAIESNGGIYHSANSGSTWRRIDSNKMKLPSRRIWSMAFDPKNPNRIFAGSHSSGVYIIERTTEVIASDPATRPRIASNGN
ncbi:MAG: YCF48-related protein [Pyrinomonadaceae bacterium]